MNKENEINHDASGFVLPIVCAHCGKENNLSVNFALMAPDAVVPKEPVINDRDDDDNDEDQEAA